MAQFIPSLLDFEKLRAVRKIAITFWRHDDDIFQTHAADSEIVKPGLDSDHVTGAQHGIDRRDARRLVDVQAEPMTGAMKESLHPAIDLASGKTAGFEESQNILMHVSAVHAVAYLLIANSLTCLHCRVHLFELIGGTTAHDGTAQIAEVAITLGAGKDVEDDRGVRLDRPAAFVMRIDTLIAR